MYVCECVCACVCVRVCLCVCVRAFVCARVDIRNTLLRNDLRKSYDKRLSESEVWNVPENELWRRNNDAEKQDLCAGVYRKVMVGCIWYRKSVSGLTGRVPGNEAGDSE